MTANPQLYYPLPPFEFRDLVPNEISGERPMLAWIDPALLVVDRRYQRASSNENSRRNIATIVTRFDWRRFKPCTVTPIDGGRYLVIDGQHSAIAAKAHPQVTDVPCWVVDAGSVVEQAQIFIGINADRIAITPLQMHRSKVVAEDPLALRIKAVCDAAGVKILNTPTSGGVCKTGETLAIGVITQIVRRDGDEVATAALTALNRAHRSEPNELRAAIIAAVSSFVAGRSNVDTDRLAKALEQTNAKAMLSSARRQKQTSGIKIHDALVSLVVRAYDGLLGGMPVTAATPPHRPPPAPAPAPISPPKPAPKPAPAREPVLVRPAPPSRAAELREIEHAIAAGKITMMPSGAELREVLKDVPPLEISTCVAWAEQNGIGVRRDGGYYIINGERVHQSEAAEKIHIIARDRAMDAWRAQKAGQRVTA